MPCRFFTGRTVPGVFPSHQYLISACSPECNQALAELINETIHKHQHDNREPEDTSKTGSFRKLLKRIAASAFRRKQK